MQILTQADLPLAAPVAVTLGFFDGVHKGHQLLLRELERQPYPGLVYTFTRKPNVGRPLFTQPERESILACAGVDYYYAANFDAVMQESSPRTFLRRFMRSFRARCLIVGEDFRFGSGAAGDPALLREMSSKYGYRLIVSPLEGADGVKYSSSQIRRLVREGDIAAANREMGRYYFIDGTVETGQGLGSRLGFPTANIQSDKLLPKNGVYATLTRTPRGLFPSVSNVGMKPTVSHSRKINIETTILNHEEDLYGVTIRVYFYDFLRSERRFDSLDGLKRQILKDEAKAKRLLSGDDVYKKYEIC